MLASSLVKAARQHDDLPASNRSTQICLHRDAMRQEIVSLIERFYHQIRYGCQEPTCAVPTCRTCRDRLTKHIPYRVPTPLTARAIASYLASLDDPMRHVCTHNPRPKLDIHDLAFPTSKVLNQLRIRKEQDKEENQEHVDNGLEHFLSVDPGLTELVGFVKEIEVEQQRLQAVITPGSENSQNEEGVGADSTLSRPVEENQATDHRIDSRSFAQKLFGTTTWRLSSFIEIYQGRYHILPPWTVDIFKPTTEESQGAHAHHSQDTISDSDCEYATMHPKVGIFYYSIPRRSARKEPLYLKLSAFGASISELPSRRTPKKKVKDLGRTCPFGTSTHNSIFDVSAEHEALLRKVWEVFESSSNLLKYAQNPRFPLSITSKEPRTLPLSFLVMELSALLNLEHHPRMIVMNLTNSLRATYFHGQRSSGAEGLPVILPFARTNAVGGSSESETEAVGGSPESEIRALGRSSEPETMDDAQAAHIINIALAVLISLVIKDQKDYRPQGWAEFSSCRRKGHWVYSESQSSAAHKTAVHYMAVFQDPMAVDLMKMILRCVASRNYRSIRPSEDGEGSSNANLKLRATPTVFMARILSFLRTQSLNPPYDRLLYNKVILEWARTVLLQEWDGQAEFSWSSDVGSAIDFMRLLYENHSVLGLDPKEFGMQVLFEKTDFVEVSKQWMAFKPSIRTDHLLSFPWLFPSSAIVTLFRAINFSAMFKSFEKSIMMNGLVNRMATYVRGPPRKLFERLRVSTNTFLVLEIRRDNILRDALNQLWRRQKRELVRPLKVRMGMDEGEEGFDLGGIQQEFFRLAIAEALDPSHGLFTVDEVTRMTWFVPCSKAPLYHYVLVGLLFGLAVFNGLTLPVTFPLALYGKLLDMPVKKLQHVLDGWPVLAKSFSQLLTFKGSVEDVFMRQYIFSFESYGVKYDIDMRKHQQINFLRPASVPKSKSGNEDSDSSVGHDEPLQQGSRQENINIPHDLRENAGSGEEEDEGEEDEAEMVTNGNRADFVKDYVDWLANKSIAPEYSAFASGFYLPLQKKSLRLFTPSQLRSLIEGVQEIDVRLLEHTAHYEDGYTSNHSTIKDFWSIVRDFTLEEKRSLLEFVTASDRVPVRGIEEMTFIIQRNGVGDERLPSSSTCFQRLLLPEYSSKEIMEQKLKVAIVNSRGFGYQ